MRVLYVAPDIPVPHTGEFVGGSTHVLKESETLAGRGYEVFIISRRMRGQKKFERLSKKIWTRRIYRGLVFPLEGKVSIGEGRKKRRKRKILENVYSLLYRAVLTAYITLLLLRYKFDLVVERSNEKGIGVLPAKLFGIKTVVEVIYGSYSRTQLKFADKILSNTKDIIPKQFHSKVVVTHDGADIASFGYDENGANEIREKYGLKGQKVVIYVGVLSEGHGPDILLGVAENLRNVKFLMVGKDLESLREEAEKRGVADRFVFTGFVKHEEIPKYISAADVTVAPYRMTKRMKTTGIPPHLSPIKVFEYMACGKPVVASDIGIVRDVVEENKCGLVAKPDVEDFAEKIRMLLEDASLRKELGENGLEAVKNYTWDKIGEEILRTL